MREWGIFQPRYLATKLIHQPDKLAGVSIADSAIGRPATCKSRSPKTKNFRFLALAYDIYLVDEARFDSAITKVSRSR